MKTSIPRYEPITFFKILSTYTQYVSAFFFKKMAKFKFHENKRVVHFVILLRCIYITFYGILDIDRDIS